MLRQLPTSIQGTLILFICLFCLFFKDLFSGILETWVSNFSYTLNSPAFGGFWHHMMIPSNLEKSKMEKKFSQAVKLRALSYMRWLVKKCHSQRIKTLISEYIRRKKYGWQVNTGSWAIRIRRNLSSLCAVIFTYIFTNPMLNNYIATEKQLSQEVCYQKWFIPLKLW